MERLDGRSLALFRIGTAGCLIYDLIDRIRAFPVFFGPQGIFDFEGAGGSYPWYSLFDISSNSVYQMSILLITLLAAISLLVGFRSRIATALCWFLVLNLHHYGRASFFGGDYVLRLLLFWGMFLPLGARASVDAWLARGRTKMPQASLWGSICLLSQVATIFLAAGLHKLFDTGWHHGLGVRVSILAHGTYFGELLLPYVGLLIALNYLVVATQLLSPLLFFPSPRFRLWGVLALCGFQIGLAFCLQLSFFPFVTIAGLLGLLPTRVWNSSRKDGAQTPWTLTMITCAVIAGFLIPNLSNPRDPRGFDRSTLALALIGLEQDWSMFAPLPEAVRWIMIRIHLENGTLVDISSSQPFTSWRLPLRISFPGRIRWAALISRRAQFPALFPRLAAGLCQAGAISSVPGGRSGAVEFDLVSSSLENMRIPDAPVDVEKLGVWPCAL